MAIKTSCQPPVSDIAKGFVRQLKALPEFSLGYDFDTVRALLLTYISINFPDWKDFLESTTGMLYLEMLAYVSMMLAFRSDFQRAQWYLDSIQDIDTLTRVMLLVGEKLKTPSPALLTQMDLNKASVNLRMIRTGRIDTGNIKIAPATKINISTTNQTIVYEIFELDNNNSPKYADAFLTNYTFPVILNNSLNSDPPSGTTTAIEPAKNWMVVEGQTQIDTFVSDGSINQMFYLKRSPIITDIANDNFITAVRLIDPTGQYSDPEWERVDSLVTSTAEDKHYEIEWDGSFRGIIKFGNNTFGKIPPINYIIQVLYRVGGGSSKKVASNVINNVISAYDDLGVTSVTINNIVPTTGGNNGDTLDIAKNLLPSRVRRQTRLVSGEDFASYAIDFSGIAKAKATLINNDGTGNLVKLMILESKTTEEGYTRPWSGGLQTELSFNLNCNTVISSSYTSNPSVGDPNTDSALTPYTVIILENTENEIWNHLNNNELVTMSRQGVYRFITQYSSGGVNYKDRFVIIGDNSLTTFPIGSVVGLNALCKSDTTFAGNGLNHSLALPASTPVAYNIEGPGVTNINWPGTENSQIAIIQIGNELIQAQVEPYFDSSNSTSWDNTSYHYLNIVSRGYYGTQVTKHLSNDKVYLGGVRTDLYTAMSKYKVEPSELLIVEGTLLPLYIKFTVRINSSATSTIVESIRVALEKYFDFSKPEWGFGKDIRFSPIIDTIQAIAGVESVDFGYATQHVLNLTDSASANYYGTITIDKDISGVPDEVAFGLLPYTEAIGTGSTVINETGSTYALSTSLPASSGSVIDTQGGIILSLTSGDLSLLPFSGLIKIKSEYIAYKERQENVLYGITRNVYNESSTTYNGYIANENVYLAPNIVINTIG